MRGSDELMPAPRDSDIGKPLIRSNIISLIRETVKTIEVGQPHARVSHSGIHLTVHLLQVLIPLIQQWQ